MSTELALQPQPVPPNDTEAHLIALVLDGVTSQHSRRSYRTGLAAFFAWGRASGSMPVFSKALVQQYRTALVAGGSSSATVNLRLSPLRKLAREMADTALGKLAPHDLRRTCAKLCRKAGGELEQIQLLLGHASIQTTERYLGTEQAFAHAVNDAIGLDMG